MEFNEKLQQLRKTKGLTQEELAEILFVSRTAVSKWESARGFPNIESLKAIAKYFSVTLDELLSSEELLILAEEDQKQKEMHVRDMVFGLFDCSMALLLFLPFFGQKADGHVQEVSLFALTGIQPYLYAAYWIVIIGTILLGVLTLALQNCNHMLWLKSKNQLSLLLGAIGVILFAVSQQPYGAVFTFVFLIMKALLLMKRQ